jgi:methionine synthase I (cobalamin-dependent)
VTDVNDLEGCNEILNEIRPGRDRHIHRNHSRRVPMLSRRNTFGCNLVNPGDCDIPDNIRELSLKGTAIACGSGSVATMSWASGRRSGDDVDFPGREALQRFRVPAGIRHARQS